MQKWNYKSLNDHVGEKFYASLATCVYSAGMLVVFNPVVAGISLGVSFIGAMTLTAGENVFGIQEKLMKGEVAKNAATPPTKKSELKAWNKKLNTIQNITNKHSKTLELKRHPQIFILKDEAFVKMALQNISMWRKVFQKKKIAEKLKRVPLYSFGAVSGPNFLFISESALKNDLNDKEVEFVIAHELSHAKVRDSQSFGRTATAFQKINTRLMVGSIGIGVILSPFTSIAALPLLAGLLAIPVLDKVSKLGVSFASRVAERRADRNAIYLTGDVKTALSTHKKLHPADAQEKKMPYFKELTKSHPPFHKRMKNAKSAWDKVSAFKQRSVAPKTTAPKFGK